MTLYQLRCMLARYEVRTTVDSEPIRWQFRREAKAYCEGLLQAGADETALDDRLRRRQIGYYANHLVGTEVEHAYGPGLVRPVGI